jgi:hypothetical protein
MTRHHQLASAGSVSADHFDDDRSDGEGRCGITEQHQQIALPGDRRLSKRIPAKPQARALTVRAESLVFISAAPRL